MDIFSFTKKLCDKYNIKPARSKGQNFLISERAYARIIQAADLNKEDIVLEVGPGLGFLTERLAEKVKKVLAVELDDKLAGALKERLAEDGIRNVEVLNEDVLKFSISNFQFSNNFQFPIFNDKPRYKIVANLPYNITSFFLRKFLSDENLRPSLMVLMLQREVAERIIARPPEMSLLAVAVQFYAEAKIMAKVPAGNFWPSPKVDSAIIRLDNRKQITDNREMRNADNRKLVSWEKVDERKFFDMVRFGFSAKRKMLKNNLAKGLEIKQDEVEKILKEQEFNPKVRAQELEVGDWVKLFGELKRFMV